MRKFVISLERRKDRRESLSVPFKVEFFDAVDGKLTYPDQSIRMQGIYGCYDSHKKLLESLLNDSNDFFLILEDDAVVNNDFEIIFNESIGTLPKDWDMIYLGGWETGPQVKYNNFFDYANKVYTTHSYIVRKKFIPTILKKLNERKWKVDVLYSEVLKDGKCFMYNPKLSHQKEGFSDIENKVTNNTHLL